MKKTINNNLTSFADHLDDQYGKQGTEERERFKEGFGGHLRLSVDMKST